MGNILRFFTLLILTWTASPSLAFGNYSSLKPGYGTVELSRIPLFKGKITKNVATVSVNLPGNQQLALNGIRINLDRRSNTSFIAEVMASYIDIISGEAVETGIGSAQIKNSRKNIQLKFNQTTPRNKHILSLGMSVKEDAQLDQSIGIE